MQTTTTVLQIYYATCLQNIVEMPKFDNIISKLKGHSVGVSL